MASKSAILCLVPVVRLELSRANALRLDQTLNLIDDAGAAVLADVLRTLYAGQKQDTALTMFRQFRRELKSAAEQGGVKLLLETDGQTRGALRFSDGLRVVAGRIAPGLGVLRSDAADLGRENREIGRHAPGPHRFCDWLRMVTRRKANSLRVCRWHPPHLGCRNWPGDRTGVVPFLARLGLARPSQQPNRGLLFQRLALPGLDRPRAGHRNAGMAPGGNFRSVAHRK